MFIQVWHFRKNIFSVVNMLPVEYLYELRLSLKAKFKTINLFLGSGLALVFPCAPLRNLLNMVKHAYFGECFMGLLTNW